MSMREDQAIQLIEDQFGPLEELAWTILAECPEVIDGEYDLDTVAGRLGVNMGPLARVLKGSTFRSVMSQAVVQSRYTIFDEIKHVDTIRSDAISQDKSINTRIAAREHLAKLEGRPLAEQKQAVQAAIQINFGGIPGASSSSATTVEFGNEDHVPRRAGDLPPPGARSRYREGSDSEADARGVSAGGELDFWSGESPYARDELEEAASKARELDLDDE